MGFTPCGKNELRATRTGTSRRWSRIGQNLAQKVLNRPSAIDGLVPTSY